jgi:hypothetical protein
MANPFDMEVFLNGVLSGSHTTRRRHLRQAVTIQTAISNRWKRNNPWTWQQKTSCMVYGPGVTRSCRANTILLLAHCPVDRLTAWQVMVRI